MSLRRNRFLAAFTLAGLSVGSLSTAWAAPDNAAVANRALAQISRFPAMTLHGPDQSYEVRDVIVDADGTEHVRVDRRYKGLRVIGGDMVVHSTVMGVLRGVSKTLERAVNVSVRPTLTADRAVSTALSGRPGYVSAGKPELVIHAREGLPELAYDVRVNGVQSDGTPSELHVIVSGVNGRVLDSWDDIETGVSSPTTGKGFFNGTVTLTTDNTAASTYYLRDPSRGNQYTLDMRNKTSPAYYFIDADNLWGDGTLSNAQTVAVDAQYGTSVTWDYYKNVHKRNGIANDGKGAYNRVHYSSRYNNAFWSDSCFCMTYGDGDGTTFNPFDSLDVAGHEMTHGVTSRTAKLVYSGESGGLNEATSDIFGTAVEFYANNALDVGDYLIGEKLYKSGNRALRSMIQPSVDGVSADCWYSGLGSIDVHYSSGVANHFFYLLAEGTTAGVPSKTCVAGNTRVASGTGTLAGIGRAKAEAIWYKALTTYMTSSTNYAGARVATLNAATALYGSGSPEYNAVAAAWSALLVN